LPVAGEDPKRLGKVRKRRGMKAMTRCSTEGQLGGDWNWEEAGDDWRRLETKRKQRGTRAMAGDD
jgi:hypothetical protein